MKRRHRIITVISCLMITLGSSQVCKAQFTLDSFDDAKNGSATFSGSGNADLGTTVLLVNGRGDWTSTGDGISGGFRVVGFGPHTGEADFSQFRVDGGGDIAISTGSEASANVTLSYGATNALNQNLFTTGRYLNLDLRSADATAARDVTLNLTFNGSETIGVRFDNMLVGNNTFDLNLMENFTTWGVDVDTVELEFDTGGNVGVDYVFGALEFTTTQSGNALSAVPEPATALAAVPLFGFFAYRRRLKKKREAAAEDEQLEAESTVE